MRPCLTIVTIFGTFQPHSRAIACCGLPESRIAFVMNWATVIAFFVVLLMFSHLFDCTGRPRANVYSVEVRGALV